MSPSSLTVGSIQIASGADPNATNMVPYGKGFGMIRNTDSKTASNRKQAFRLALMLVVSGSASLASTDSGIYAQTPQANACELPVYPFAPTTPVAADAGAKKAMVRILGFRGSKAAPQVTSNNTSPFGGKAISDAVELPSLPRTLDSSLSNLPLASLPQLVAESTVVAANATRPVQGVQASLTDSNEEESHDAIDLMNSLEEMMSPPAIQATRGDFTDSIQIEIPDVSNDSVEAGISMNMSDRASHTGTMQSKAPELVNTKRNKSLRAETTVQPNDGASRSATSDSAETMSVYANALPSKAQQPQLLQPSQSQASSPLPTPITSAISPFEPPAIEVQSTASSRKEHVPGAMNIRVEGEPGLVAVPSRPPLVPMLASGTSRTKMPELTVTPNQLQPSMPKPMPVPAGNFASSQGKEVSVKVKDSIALQSIDAIQGLSVENEGVCQVIQTGTKTFSLIGLRPGETRVAVITETEGKRNVQIQQVRVGAAPSTGQDSSSIAQEISHTIQQLYPRSKVRITTRGNELVVGGKVESEDTAKKILSFIRKTTLTPVVDELQTH